MNIRQLFKILGLLIIFLIMSSPAAFCEGIKDRMIKRLPAIAELKIQGIIGENNRGYLGFVTEEKIQEDVIEAENADRKSVYEAFAKQQNTTVDVVEKVQADRKAEKANPGEYYQDQEGKWVKK